MEKPINLVEYKTWLKKELNVDISSKHKTQYELISSKIKSDFEKSKFWGEILDSIEGMNNEYYLENGFYLFIPNFKPELVTKPYSSFFEKTYRKNILLNKKWPNEPSYKWVKPENWFESINDILRTCFVVKYLDGVEFLLKKIKEIGGLYNFEFKEYFEAREEGYYAAHLYLKCKFEIPRDSWDTEEKSISIEIQIVTQLQDVIRKLTHKYYEERRVQIQPSDKKWQWNYQSDEFASNYLGHILHYVEGMIMEIRKKQKNKILNDEK